MTSIDPIVNDFTVDRGHLYIMECRDVLVVSPYHCWCSARPCHAAWYSVGDKFFLLMCSLGNVLLHFYVRVNDNLSIRMRTRRRWENHFRWALFFFTGKFIGNQLSFPCASLVMDNCSLTLVRIVQTLFVCYLDELANALVQSIHHVKLIDIAIFLHVDINFINIVVLSTSSL